MDNKHETEGTDTVPPYKGKEKASKQAMMNDGLHRSVCVWMMGVLLTF